MGLDALAKYIISILAKRMDVVWHRTKSQTTPSAMHGVTYRSGDLTCTVWECRRSSLGLTDLFVTIQLHGRTSTIDIKQDLLSDHHRFDKDISSSVQDAIVYLEQCEVSFRRMS